MNIKYFIVLFVTLVFSSSCAPAYYESLFQNKNEISPKDQLRLRSSIKTRDWELAYKIANTYPLVQNTFHDLRRIQDALVHYDVCIKGKRTVLSSCFNSEINTFKNMPQKTQLGKPTDQFIRRFMVHVRNEMGDLRKEVLQKRKLELAKIERQKETLRLRKDEALVAENKRKASKKVKTKKLTRRQSEINWSRQVGEDGIRDALAATDLHVKKIIFDMRENEDRSFNFSLDILHPQDVDIAHNAPVVQKSLEIILENIGEVTRKTRIKSRYLFVAYQGDNNNLKYQFKTKEARIYWNKLKQESRSAARKYLKDISLTALGRHEKAVLAKH